LVARSAVWLAVLAAALGYSACVEIAPSPANAAAAEPDSKVYGIYLSARLAASQHDLADAARLYRDSLDEDPENPDLLSRAFLYTAAAGNLHDAAELATRLIKQEPDNRAARLTLAVAAFKAHDYTAARMHIAQSGRGPFTALTLTILDAWAAQGLGDMKTAQKDLKDVPNQGGTQAMADIHRALMLDLSGDAGAEGAYQAAIAGQASLSPRLADAYGRFLERAGRADDARAFYEKLAPQAALEPLAKAGLARLQSGAKPDRMVQSADAGAGEALFGIATALTDQSSADISILYLRLALELAPDNDLAKIVLADHFETLQKYNDAIELYRGIGTDSPYHLAAMIQVAVDEGRLKQNDKAIADLQAITRSEPDSLEAWTALGDAYRSLEKYEDAAGAYDRAIRTLGPAHTSKEWPLFYARGVAEERAQHWAAAEADLSQALKLSPEQPDVLNYLGYSWVDRHENLSQALGMLEKARTLSPFDGYIVDSVGWAYYRLGRYEDAAKALEAAVLLVPGDPTINDHLGDAYWRVGKKLDAHFQWSHALAFGPDDKEKPRIEEKLAHGLGRGDAS